MNTLIIENKLNLKNKVVIFYDGVNNVADNCLVNNSGLETSRQIQINEYINKPKASNLFYYIEPFIYIFEFIKKYIFENNYQSSNFRDCDEDNSKAETVSNNLINTWKLTKKIVENNGGKFILVLQPVIYIGEVKRDHIDLTSDNDLDKNYEVVYKMLQRKALKIFGNSFLDFSNVLDDEDYYYIDFNHHSPNGNFLIARQLSENLNKLNLFKN